MKNFYNLFQYQHRSKGSAEIFSKCTMLQDLGPFVISENVAYIIVNVDLGTIELHGGPKDEAQNYTKIYKGTLTVSAK